MKIVFNILSIVIVVTITFLASLNTHTVFDFTVWSATKTANAMIYHATLVQVILLTFIAGTLTGIFWASSFYSPIQAKLKEYQRKLEKTSVQSSEDSSKVSILEEKINVLEKALQSALEKE